MAEFTVEITKPATNPATTYTNVPQSYAAAAYVDDVEVSSDAVTWSWDFGDGSAPATDNPAIYAYASSGGYTVTVTATLVATNDTASATTGIIVEDTLGGGWKLDPPAPWSPIGVNNGGDTEYLAIWDGYHVQSGSVSTAEGADWGPPPYYTASGLDCAAGSKFTFERPEPYPGNPGLLYDAWAQGTYACSAQAYNQDPYPGGYAHARCWLQGGFQWAGGPSFLTSFDDWEYEVGLVGQVVGTTLWGPVGMYNQVASSSPTTIDFYVLTSTLAQITPCQASCAIGYANMTGDVAIDDLGLVYP
jgi:hypothetical protein